MTEHRDDWPWFPFYAKDWLTATSHMDAMAVGAYIRLLCKQWEDGYVPSCSRARRSVVGIAPRWWPEVWKQIAEHFPPMPDDPNRLQNQRLERIREKQREAREKRSNAGRKGGIATAKPPAMRFIIPVGNPGNPGKPGVTRVTPEAKASEADASSELSIGGWYGATLRPLCRPNRLPDSRAEREAQNRDISVLKRQLASRSRADTEMVVREVRRAVDAGEIGGIVAGDSFGLRFLMAPTEGVNLFDAWLHRALKRGTPNRGTLRAVAEILSRQ